VFAGLEVAENDDVAGSELDDLAVADIVHEFDVGRGAFHVFDEGGWDERSRRAGGNLRRNKGDGAEHNRCECLESHGTPSVGWKKPFPNSVLTKHNR
jgi:hypothetical protein